MSLTAVKLLPAKPEDAEFLYRVFAETRWALPAGIFSSGSPLEPLGRQQYALRTRQYREKFGTERFVISCNGCAAGAVWLAHEADSIRVVDLAVLPAFQHRGIATAVLQEVFREATLTAARVCLTVDCANEGALRLYRRLGFRIVEQVTADWSMEWVAAGRESTGE